MPHAAKCLVDIAHDLRRRVAPAQLEQLLPDVAGVTVDHGLWDTTKQLMDHGSLVLLGHTIESLLNDVTAESVHAERQRVAADGLCDGGNLIRCAMLEAALDEEVAEAVDHQRVGLSDDSLDDIVLLIWRTHLELLLQKYGSLLIVVADDLVDNVLPVAAHIAIKQSAIVHGLDRMHVLRTTTLAGSLQSLSVRITKRMKNSYIPVSSTAKGPYQWRHRIRLQPERV